MRVWLALAGIGNLADSATGELIGTAATKALLLNGANNIVRVTNKLTMRWLAAIAERENPPKDKDNASMGMVGCVLVVHLELLSFVPIGESHTNPHAFKA